MGARNRRFDQRSDLDVGPSMALSIFLQHIYLWQIKQEETHVTSVLPHPTQELLLAGPLRTFQGPQTGAEAQDVALQLLLVPKWGAEMSVTIGDYLVNLVVKKPSFIVIT